MKQIIDIVRVENCRACRFSKLTWAYRPGEVKSGNTTAAFICTYKLLQVIGNVDIIQPWCELEDYKGG